MGGWGGFCISSYYSRCHFLNPLCLCFVRVRRKNCFNVFADIWSQWIWGSARPLKVTATVEVFCWTCLHFQLEPLNASVDCRHKPEEYFIHFQRDFSSLHSLQGFCCGQLLPVAAFDSGFDAVGPRCLLFLSSRPFLTSHKKTVFQKSSDFCQPYLFI